MWPERGLAASLGLLFEGHHSPVKETDFVFFSLIPNGLFPGLESVCG